MRSLHIAESGQPPFLQVRDIQMFRFEFRFFFRPFLRFAAGQLFISPDAQAVQQKPLM